MCPGRLLPGHWASTTKAGLYCFGKIREVWTNLRSTTVEPIRQLTSPAQRWQGPINAIVPEAIDFAIQRGLRIVEAGAQGEHKIARGYLPQTTYSAHYIADPGLRRAIDEYLRRERAYVAEAARELTEAAPFRKTSDGQS